VDVIALAIYGALAAALASGRLTIAELAAGAFLMAIGGNFFSGAMTASLRTLVPAPQRPGCSEEMTERRDKLQDRTLRCRSSAQVTWRGGHLF